MKHKEILNFIKTVRHSFLDATIAYRYGGCYGFYQILKCVNTKAQAFFADEDKDHILTKIDGRYYDICGEIHLDKNELKAVKALSKTDHERWEGVSSGQRFEFILAKYNRNVSRTAKDT